MTTAKTRREASQDLLDAERQALAGIQAAATTFRDALNGIVSDLDYAPGFKSDAVNIANGMTANLSYQLGTQLPQLIQQMTPLAPVPDTTA
jgi:hypothetical protein